MSQSPERNTIVVIQKDGTLKALLANLFGEISEQSGQRVVFLESPEGYDIHQEKIPQKIILDLPYYDAGALTFALELRNNPNYDNVEIVFHDPSPNNNLKSFLQDKKIKLWSTNELLENLQNL